VQARPPCCAHNMLPPPRLICFNGSPTVVANQFGRPWRRAQRLLRVCMWRTGWTRRTQRRAAADNDGPAGPISDPRYKMEKPTGWVKASLTDAALAAFAGEVCSTTASLSRPLPPAACTRPMRVRRAIPITWISLGIREDRNRRVRHEQRRLAQALVGRPLGPYRLARQRGGRPSVRLRLQVKRTSASFS
jgi:hypothetical protein